MAHSGVFDREYFCHECHLLYDGYWRTGEREVCPNCASPAPCACDTFAHCYCPVSNLEPTEDGRTVAETFWWREEWTRPDFHAFYHSTSYANQREPSPVLPFWKKREAAYVASKMGDG